MSLDPVQVLLDKDAIQNIKYEYFRRLDSKQFDDLIKLFTEDATTAYDNGRHSCHGREEIFNFLDESMSKHEFLSQHQAHHPEITFVDETHATGMWHFEDTCYILDDKVKITGAGIYWDEYVKTDQGWLISHTGYERLWVCTEKLNLDNYLEIRSFWDAKELERSNQRNKTAGELQLYPQR